MSLKSLWRTYVWNTSTPWADIGYDGKKLLVKGFNKAFVDEQRNKQGDLCDGKTDKEIVNLFVDRENVEREDPKLDIIHMGIEADGKIKVKLDWNRAFIRHLQENGISGETEDEAIQAYLQLLTMNELQGETTPEEFFSKDQIEEAFGEMDRELDQEFDVAKKQSGKSRRRKMR
jgi:hypothetical protein